MIPLFLPLLFLAALFYALLQFRHWVAEKRELSAFGRVFYYLRPASEGHWSWIWALEYEILTEEFDRTLPGYWSYQDSDCWCPVDLSESCRYAQRLRKVAFPVIGGVFSTRTIQRMTHSTRKIELERALEDLRFRRVFVPRLKDVAFPPAPRFDPRCLDF